MCCIVDTDACAKLVRRIVARFHRRARVSADRDVAS